MRRGLLWMLLLAWALWGAVGAEEAKPFMLRWEAETLPSAGTQPETDYAKEASGGAYVYLAKGEKDRAKPPQSQVKIEFDAPEGAYRLRVRVLAINGSSDSFFVITEQTSRSAGVKTWKEWSWVEMPIRLGAEKRHTLLIAAREPARIDAIELVAAGKGESMLCIRQSVPTIPEPNEYRSLDVNPPTFRWEGDWMDLFAHWYAKAVLCGWVEISLMHFMEPTKQSGLIISSNGMDQPGIP